MSNPDAIMPRHKLISLISKISIHMYGGLFFGLATYIAVHEGAYEWNYKTY